MPKATRRTFLKAAAVTSAGYMVIAGNERVYSQSPNERPGVACVGVGGKGGSDCNNAGKFGKIIAICDTDRNRLDAKGKAEDCVKSKKYLDYREMLMKHEKDIEIVTISTPDHMHAPVTLMAMRMGKSCYTQKPLTRTIYEARKLTQVAKETGVCTQMGNQGSALNASRDAIAQLQAGVLGKLKEVYVWSNRPVWPQKPNRTMTMAKYEENAKKDNPEKAAEIIAAQKGKVVKDLENLDWKLWLGVAPEREYWPGLYHNFAWRGWWDFGSGALGDMACHMMTVPFEGCNLRDPVSVKAKTTGHDFDSFPESSIIEFQFPEMADRPPIKFWWYDRQGNVPPPEVFEPWGIEPIKIVKGRKPINSGVLVIGEKGAFYSSDDYCGKYEFKGDVKLIPTEELKVVYAEPRGGFDADNMFELFRAVDTKNPKLCRSNFIDRGGPLTETILLGNLAVWAANKGGPDGAMMSDWGPTIEWDAKDLKVKNLDAIRKSESDFLADKILSLVTPKYPSGYRLD